MGIFLSFFLSSFSDVPSFLLISLAPSTSSIPLYQRDSRRPVCRAADAAGSLYILYIPCSPIKFKMMEWQNVLSSIVFNRVG